MKIFEKFRLFLFLLSAAVLSVFPTGCMKDEIEDLRQRVESLESVVETLQEMMDNGAMIKGITPLEDGSGWLIEFTGESVAPIEIRNGGTGVTPMIDIRPCEDGGYSLWYNITPGYPEDGWIDTGVDLRAPGEESLLSGIVRNADGTVTFIMNDGLGTEYTFAMYSTVSHIEIMVSDTVAVSDGQDAKIVFRVNPSSAWVPTGSGEAISQWALDEFGTKSGYVNASEVFVLESVLPDGEYVIDDNLNAGYALAGYLDPAGQRAGTWLMYMEDGELAGMAPIISGTVTSRYADGLYSIKIEGTDDAGNAISGILVGAAPAGDAAAAAPGSIPGVL